MTEQTSLERWQKFLLKYLELFAMTPIIASLTRSRRAGEPA
jgi:hypothetical protein